MAYIVNRPFEEVDKQIAKLLKDSPYQIMETNPDGLPVHWNYYLISKQIDPYWTKKHSVKQFPQIVNSETKENTIKNEIWLYPKFHFTIVVIRGNLFPLLKSKIDLVRIKEKLTFDQLKDVEIIYKIERLNIHSQYQPEWEEIIGESNLELEHLIEKVEEHFVADSGLPNYDPTKDFRVTKKRTEFSETVYNDRAKTVNDQLVSLDCDTKHTEGIELGDLYCNNTKHLYHNKRIGDLRVLATQVINSAFYLKDQTRHEKIRKVCSNLVGVESDLVFVFGIIDFKSEKIKNKVNTFKDLPLKDVIALGSAIILVEKLNFNAKIQVIKSE